MVERKNINRGYRKLRVWQRGIDLYALVCEKVGKIPRHLYKLKGQMISAAASAHGNIAEGYCRRSIKEYLNFLNIALASLGELGSYLYGCHQAKQLDEQDYDELDKLHYEVENSLIKLIESLQKKQKAGEWEDSFLIRDDIEEYLTSQTKED